MKLNGKSRIRIEGITIVNTLKQTAAVKVNADKLIAWCIDKTLRENHDEY